MLIIGHRGCSYPGYNQNTIRAFEKVTEEGVQAIEFDVQLSRDGELVVVHNLDLEEVSTGTGAVSETSFAELKELYAGDPARGKDRIPSLSELFDFFASVSQENRPAIHMELKGDNTGIKAGNLFNEYVKDGILDSSDVLASSFNWQELERIRSVCPTIKVALLDGAIRRSRLLAKTGPEAEQYFERIFAYGGEEYMLPRFTSLYDNEELMIQENVTEDSQFLLKNEIKACLAGQYYTDDLLNAACEMRATSVNLWFQTVNKDFVDKAHDRGLAVFVYTVNKPQDWQKLVEMGVDGFFTDYYTDASEFLQN